MLNRECIKNTYLKFLILSTFSLCHMEIKYINVSISVDRTLQRYKTHITFYEYVPLYIVINLFNLVL